MNILMVEDNEGDRVLIREAFQEAHVDCELRIVDDAVEALDFLNHQGQFQDALKPDVIILDLSLPRKNGREFLRDIKRNPKFVHIPVLVFTNSVAPTDICDCYSLNANVYVGKPSGFKGFIDFANIIRVFWMGQVSYCPLAHESGKH